MPVLLSIGYSACHWCHVMAHESFEDEDTAAVMNEHFVNIKVDREQRPDVDAVYMEATQAMTGHGGWPMTVFLTPDGEPFQCGTYYPKQRRHGMPAFVEVLAAIEDLWRTKRADLLEQAAQLTEHLQRSGLPVGRGQGAARTCGRRRRGATGCWRCTTTPGAASVGRRSSRSRWRSTCCCAPGDRCAVEAAVTSLEAMASGGHVGPPRRRLRPVLGRRRVARPALREDAVRPGPAAPGLPPRLAGDGIGRRCGRSSRSSSGTCCATSGCPGGGFASAEDADSEGEEGLFYTWTPDELAAVLGEDGRPAGRRVLGRAPTAGTSRAGRSSTGCTPGASSTGPPEIEALRAALFEARGRRGCGRASTTRC